MPDLEITIGGRNFTVTCQAGEEPFLQAAAKLLDEEATPLQDKVGRLPDVRLLLMAGLMLADRTATLEEDLRRTKARVADMEHLLKQTAASDLSGGVPEAVDRLAQIATQAEALANRLEAHLG